MIRAFVLVAALGLQACASVRSDQSFRAALPEPEQLVRVEIIFSSENHWPPESKTEVVSESRRLAMIHRVFVSVSDSWQPWGIITLPAAEI